MKRISIPGRRFLPEWSAIRLERCEARIPLSRLAVESGISAARLSLAERGRAVLTPEEETARRSTLDRLRVRAAADGEGGAP